MGLKRRGLEVIPPLTTVRTCDSVLVNGFANQIHPISRGRPPTVRRCPVNSADAVCRCPVNSRALVAERLNVRPVCGVHHMGESWPHPAALPPEAASKPEVISVAEVRCTEKEDFAEVASFTGEEILTKGGRPSPVSCGFSRGLPPFPASARGGCPRPSGLRSLDRRYMPDTRLT